MNKYRKAIGSKYQKFSTSNLLYVVAIILICIWAAVFFAYHAGNVIHILLVVALIAILLRLIREKKTN
jgi:hypothetical protein